MWGYVQTFRPFKGCGTLIDEQGKVHRFATRDGDFHGGDVVQFNLASGQHRVSQIEVIQGAADRLTATKIPLLRELFSTIEMDTIPG